MSIRNLDKMFRPRSIAVIGASARLKSVGAALMTNLMNGGFDGPIMPVNPKATALHGIMTYKDVESLPLLPDLAVIATPPDTIPGLVDELGRRGTRAAVILTARGRSRGRQGTQWANAGRRASVFDAHRWTQLPRHRGSGRRLECNLRAGCPAARQHRVPNAIRCNGDNRARLGAAAWHRLFGHRLHGRYERRRLRRSARLFRA